MARTGYPSKYGPVLVFNPRGVSSNDWSDPNDFAAADTVRYYVDSAASDDSGDGLTPSTPKKTLAAGLALLRAGAIAVPGRPDQLLLNRGSTFTDQTLGYMTTTGAVDGAALSGRSMTQRVVIGTYGTGDRPTIRGGASQIPPITTGLLELKNFAVLGIDFDNYLYPAGNGASRCIECHGPSDYVLVEDCLFRRAQTSILGHFASWQKNWTVRRNVFLEQLQGEWIKLGKADGWLIEENHFDGTENLSWSTILVRAGIEGDTACWSKNVFVIGNTFSNFPTHAVYLPAGAVVRDNVIFLGAHGIQVGNRYEGTNPGFSGVIGGVVCEIVGNYISDSMDLPASVNPTPYVGGRAISVANTMSGGLVEDNIITRCTATQPYAIYIDGAGTTSGGFQAPCLDLSIRRNKVYRWWRTPNPYHYKGIFIGGNNQTGQPPDIGNVAFKNNDIQEPAGSMSLLVHFDNTLAASGEIDSARNRFFRTGQLNDRYSPTGFGSTDIAGYRLAMADADSVETQVPYPDPDKTIADYHASIGGTATVAAYVAAVRAQSRYTTGGASGWNDDLMASKVLDYMRANFSA